MKAFMKSKGLMGEYLEFKKEYSKKWHADYRKLIKVSKTNK